MGSSRFVGPDRCLGLPALSIRDAARVFGQPPQQSPFLALVFAIMMAHD